MINYRDAGTALGIELVVNRFDTFRTEHTRRGAFLVSARRHHETFFFAQEALSHDILLFYLQVLLYQNLERSFF